jgi:secernin
MTSCDALVVLAAHTRDGHTLFAKNSDRPATECQLLYRGPAVTHPPGSTVRCQYLEVPQAPAMLAVPGSRPVVALGLRARGERAPRGDR